MSLKITGLVKALGGFVLLNKAAMNSLAVKKHEVCGKQRALLGAKLTMCKKPVLTGFSSHSLVVILLQ